MRTANFKSVAIAALLSMGGAYRLHERYNKSKNK